MSSSKFGSSASKNLHKCLPLIVQEIQKVLPKEGSSMTCKLISIADIPHDSLIDQPTNLWKIFLEMLLEIEHVDFLSSRCANYAH
jgi:hypothetical protein